MRILHLANHCRNSGNGIVNVAVDLATSQAADRHFVAFASAKGEFEQLLTKSGVRFVEIDMRRRSPAALLGAFSRLRRLVKEFRPDIVHAHMMTGAVLARLLKPMNGFALVTHVHNEFQRSAIVMGIGDRIIANSVAVGAALVKRGMSKARVRVIRNGPLGTPRHENIASLAPAPVERPAILTVAGLNHRKGIADLIDAFTILAPKFPDLKLYIVGDGPQREEFKQHAARSPARERIVFAGFAPDPRPFMLAADVFVLASRDEPFGLVLVEARALGCAIVATNVGGIPEALDDGEAGVLTEPGNTLDLARAIADLLDTPDKRQALRLRAAANLEPFTLARLNREVLHVYREIVPAV